MTLSEINITPLLDLAFVLLIIFVITTPLLTQSLELNLPQGGKPDRPLSKKDVRTVEIDPKGVFYVDGQPKSLDQLEVELRASFKINPNLVVYIRADEMGRNKDLYAVINRCQRNGITRYSLRTEPPKR